MHSFFTRARPLAAVAALALAAAACGADAEQAAAGDQAGDDAAAADWAPSEPIDYIAPAGSGGGWDTLARTTGRVLEASDLTDVAFPVQNVEGGGGAVGWANVARKAGDDHTLFVTSPPIILVPLAGESGHDHTDFTPIARLITDYMVFLVPADSDLDSIGELFDRAATEGDSFAIAGGSAPGSMDHIALAGAVDAAGHDARAINYVPFSGGGEAMTAALGGHVDAVVTGAGEALAQIEAGTLRALATSAPAGESPLDGVPSLAEEGIDHGFDIWRGVMGPPDMDPSAVAYYEQLFADMLELDEWAEQRDGLGWIDAYQDGAEFGAFLDEQRAQFETILDDLGLLG
ncbi:tripartite tricarboxylate transporter substrate binding protein [Egicoccus sp. AB-alg2]|uniref:tripartite tricarboxylate transporter substrate binding protein n=1 Tax=Egicoccus sp. AB-alg2 TaxID=3242693 RepID=UPI00359EC6C8